MIGWKREFLCYQHVRISTQSRTKTPSLHIFFDTTYSRGFTDLITEIRRINEVRMDRYQPEVRILDIIQVLEAYFLPLANSGAMCRWISVNGY